MNFKGAVISDALMMDAVRERFESSDAVVEALSAGCDMFIICGEEDVSNVEFATRLGGRILGAISSGAFSEEIPRSAIHRASELLNAATTPQFTALTQATLDKHLELANRVEFSVEELDHAYSAAPYPKHRDSR